MAKIGIMLEAQEDLTWQRWHNVVDRAEALGFESLWRSDHLIPLVSDHKKEALEAWVSFATLAVRTRKIRFGPMVSPMTFRHPSLVAKMAASIDQLSGGRLEMGLGAGWHHEEHVAFGVPFHTMRDRFEMLEEGLQVIVALWTRDDVSFNGKHYSLEKVTCYPKPAQRPHPPIIIGGNGERRTIPLTATYADEWNASGLTLERFTAKREILRAHCEKAGREPDSVKCSLMATFLIGRDEGELQRRLDRIQGITTSGHDLTGLSSGDLVRRGWIAGTPAQVVEQMQALAQAGVWRFVLQIYDYDDLEVLDILASDVMPLIDRD